MNANEVIPENLVAVRVNFEKFIPLNQPSGPRKADIWLLSKHVMCVYEKMFNVCPTNHI